MSTTTLNFHGCASATADVQHVGDTHWLTLSFVDDNGANLSVTLFNPKPEALLAQLLAGSVETIQLGAYAEGRADQCEADGQEKPRACTAAYQCKEREFCESESRCAATMGAAE